MPPCGGTVTGHAPSRLRTPSGTSGGLASAAICSYQRIMNIIALRKEENQMILDDVTEDIKNSNEPIIDLKEKKYAN